MNERTFKWTDESIFDYASWAEGQPFCDKVNLCSLVLICRSSQSDHKKMKAKPIGEKQRQVCVIDLTDDVAVEKAYLSTLRNDTGTMRAHDADQLVEILFHDEISSVRTLVQRMKTIRKVSAEASLAKGIACATLVLTFLLCFIVFYLYRVQNSYLHLKHVTNAQRDVSD